MSKVSVILPVYNAAQYLREAINSILCQTYQDWELIIINDGSTDDSKTISCSYKDSRIKYFENEQNIGLIKTLNRAINLSSGEYIARMDADDISLADRLQLQKDFLDKNKSVGVCGTAAYIINQNGVVTGKIRPHTQDSYLRIHLLFSVPFIHPSVMVRRNILKELTYDFEYKHAEDYDLWTRIADSSYLHNLPQHLLKYRWHSSNVSVVNEGIQQSVKQQITIRELSKIDLRPTPVELYLHTFSFSLFDAKSRSEKKNFNQYEELASWFAKIVKANSECNRYKRNDLIAFLWTRWVVVCVAQKRYQKIFKPHFVPMNVVVWMKTLQQVFVLARKL